jgi:small subunit ribosomal protein S30e
LFPYGILLGRKSINSLASSPITKIGQEETDLPSHGSVAKAGKVRKQTPKVEGANRSRASPRIRGRLNYVKRILHDRPMGQTM